MSETDFPADPFWDWSLEVYGRPEVAKACLTLQERHGLDVNILLFCCWAAARGRRLDPRDVVQAVEHVRLWHSEVVVPLRRIRQWMKGSVRTAPSGLAEMLRRRVAAVELDAEHLEQIMLSPHAAAPDAYAMDAKGTDFARMAADGLAAYAAASRFDWRHEDLRPLTDIVTAAGPQFPLDRIRSALNAVCGGNDS